MNKIIKAVCTGMLVLYANPGFVSASPSSKVTIKRPVKLTLLGNSGFLIECQGKTILVDALFGHGESFTRCIAPPEDLLQRMETGQAPFDRIDLIAASHAHRDHFTATCVAQHLSQNSHTCFVSTDAAVEDLKAQDLDIKNGRDRVFGLTPESNRPWQICVNGIKVKAFGTTHSPPQTHINNLVFIFEINGCKILHTGDTSLASRDEYTAMGLPHEHIDVGLIHKGFFLWSQGRGQSVIADSIQPEHIVLHHVYRDEIDRLAAKLPALRETFPNLYFLKAPLDTKILQVEKSDPTDSQPVLRLGVNNWEFWRNHKRGECSGADVDVWREIAKRNHLEMECVFIPRLKHLRPAMEANAIDAFVTMLKRPEREAYIHFLEPPMRTKLKFFTYVRADSDLSIERHEDMRGRTIAIPGAAYERMNDDKAIQKEFVGWYARGAFEKLRQGTVDAVHVNQWQDLWYFREGNTRDGFRRANYVYNEYHPCYLVMSKKSPLANKWRDRFGHTIQAMLDDGTMKRIIEAYVPDWYEVYDK